MPKWLIFIGAALIVLGVVWQYAPWMINWFGRLPGDISYRGENTSVFIPITSMIVISILFTLISSLLSRF